jgi:hypothetical protein
MWMEVSGIMFGNTSFSALANTLKATVENYCTSNPNRNIELLGHSLGGALATTIYYMGLLPGSNIGAKVITCRTYNIYAVPNYWHNVIWQACTDHAISPTIGSIMRDRVYHYISANDYAPALVRSKPYGTVKVFDDGLVNPPLSSLLGVAWLVYTESQCHKITLFTGATDYPVELTSYSYTTNLVVGSPIMFASEKAEAVSNAAGAEVYHLKIMLTNTATDWQLSTLKENGDDEDHYEWIPQVVPDEYLIYEEGANKFWSKKYQLSSDNSDNTTNAGGTFTKDVYFRHSGVDENYVNIISGDKSVVYMVNNGQFQNQIYPWNFYSNPNNAIANVGYYDPGASVDKTLRGQWLMHYGSDLAQLTNGDPWGEVVAVGHRRLLDISNYVAPITVAPEIQNGIYRVWCADSVFIDGSSNVERKIVNGPATSFGHATNTPASNPGATNYTMSVQSIGANIIPSGPTLTIKDEWTITRFPGTGNIRLVCNSEDVRVSIPGVPDDVAYNPTISDELYLYDTGTTLSPNNLSGTFRVCEIRGTQTGSSTVEAITTSQGYWGSAFQDPVAFRPQTEATHNGGTNRRYFLFELVSGAGIP